MDYTLSYTRHPSVQKGYTDSSWIRNTEDNSSTSGWVFFLGGGVISWASKKQTCITSSTMQFEFVALASPGKEAEWLKNLILEISLWSKRMTPISIRCDSEATLAKAYSQMYNGKSRHVGVMNNMISELIINGVIPIEFVRFSSGSNSSEDVSSTGYLVSESIHPLNSSACVLFRELVDVQVIEGMTMLGKI
ncbi:hypothetical protein Tco_0563274 [Tanacetum coccineum]